MKGKYERKRQMVARSEEEFIILSDSGYSREILKSKTESTVTEETKPTFRQEQ